MFASLSRSKEVYNCLLAWAYAKVNSSYPKVAAVFTHPLQPYGDASFFLLFQLKRSLVSKIVYDQWVEKSYFELGSQRKHRESMALIQVTRFVV